MSWLFEDHKCIILSYNIWAKTFYNTIYFCILIIKGYNKSVTGIPCNIFFEDYQKNKIKFVSRLLPKKTSAVNRGFLFTFRI